MSEIKVNKISPATSTDITLGDSGDTFTVPSGATIVNSGTATGFGGGNLGQVIQTTYATQETVTTADHDIMTMASITPASSSSRFLININLWLAAASNPNGGMVLYRDSTALLVHSNPHSSTDTFWSANESLNGLLSSAGMENFNWSYIDSPATASAIVYKLSANSITSMIYNRSGAGANDAASTSTMIVSELLS